MHCTHRLLPKLARILCTLRTRPLLVRLDDVASRIVNANHSIMRSAVKLCVADCVAECIRPVVPQATEWQRIGNQIDAAAMIVSEMCVEHCAWLALANSSIWSHGLDRSNASLERLRLCCEVSRGKKAILPQSDVGKTKGEIQGNFNRYPVIIGRKTPQPLRREAR